MRRAILSDIHSNLEAFEAVLKDIESKQVDEILCLGDLIGYGPNPREVILKALSFAKVLRGNHEDALLFIATDFNKEASAAIDWTREQLNIKTAQKDENHQLWNFLGDLTDRYDADGMVFVHGSPRVPTREYVRAADVHDTEKMTEIFGMIERIGFCGHTHEPGIFTDDGKFLFPKLVNNQHVLDARKTLVNVGSVGQPRDRDNRACYVIFDGERVSFHRVEYDFKKTMKKISETPALPSYLAARLKDGR